MLFWILLACGILVASAQDVRPQASVERPAILEGYVLDPADAVVINFRVQLRNAKKKYVVESDGVGHYEFRDLEPGIYLLEPADKGCFKAARKISVRVEKGIRIHKDLELRMGKPEECSSYNG